MIAALLMSAGFLFPCSHGPYCDARTITWDASPGADSYTLYWKMGSVELDYWEQTVDICPASCQAPCRESCLVYIRHPEFPGDIVYFSLTASNAAGESGH